MNAFEAHKRIVDTYATYIKSFIDIKDDRIRSRVEEELNSGKLWPDPLIQFNPAYLPGTELKALVDAGVLHKELANVFQQYKLYRHQEEALRLGCTDKDFVVTSGTGSGKSLTFLGTIFHRILTENNGHIGVQAVIVYPMNALINSQTKEIEGYRQSYEKYTGSPFPFTFEQYTGQESKEKKQSIRENPPDIILTNYMMLELLLTRSEDAGLRESIVQNLSTLVFDELHTYRGRQGSDIAILIRRLRAIAKKQVLCIGTSATMISGTSMSEQRKAVAQFASTLFGKPFSEAQIIHESLRPNFEASAPTKEEIRAALEKKIDVDAPLTNLLINPIAIWLESNVALETNECNLVRKNPQKF